MTETYEDRIRQFAGFTHAHINLTVPVNMNADLDFKQLNLIVGKNGAGKSLINKLNWVAVTFFNSKIVEKVHNLTESKTDVELLQFLMDNTFDQQDFTGELKFYVREELLKVIFYTFKFKIDGGKVSDISFDFPPDVLPSNGATYLSTFVRDFSNIELYLKTKNMLGIDKLTDWTDIEKLCQMFKLYDILAIEQVIPKIENAGKMLSQFKEAKSMGLLDDFDLVDMEVDRKKGELYYYGKDKVRTRLSTLGAGDQSIIMMIVSILASA